MIRLPYRGHGQAGDQRAAASAFMPMQRHLAPADAEDGAAFDDGIAAMARQRARDHVADPGDADAVDGVHGRGACHDAAVGGLVAEPDDCERHVRIPADCAGRHSSHLRSLLPAHRRRR
jgi:hypothetical protein